VPSALPDGDPAPPDGLLPPTAALGAQDRSFGVYLHIPFCASRCGYCDFTTYTSAELGGGGDQSAYADTAIGEIDLAVRVLEAASVPRRPASTVFFGGGTPTLLPAADLVRLLTAVRDRFGLSADAEVTTEANPDSVTRQSLAELADGGFTRVSFGMQSARRHVLAVLERSHDPLRLPDVVGWAREAGLAVSLDLIYGTPGERLEDWTASVEAAVALSPDHLSAYALVVEAGTRLATRVGRGELPRPDDDDLATKYEAADELLTTAGYHWYEVSNWSRRPEDACRHNLAYWQGQDWWGVGCGAHSHVGGVRWWNLRHPRAYAQALGEGRSPAAAREVLGEADRRAERVLLGVRLAEGLPLTDLDAAGRSAVAALVADGLVEPGPALGADAARPRRVVLTRRGRLLADAVVRALLP
jgi:putative oxygen-independent coproporphyrinogen III oxidase